MVSTLIVRDVLLAVNGAPEGRGEAGEKLRARVQAVAAFEAGAVEECLEVLQPSAGGSESDLEVLEALTILGIARPDTCARLGISPVQVGRRFASRLDAEGRTADAISALEYLTECFPDDGALERDRAALARCQGMVADRIQRYLDRANALVEEGRVEQAIEWLREVLLLDRTRKDVARMIRDLRHQETDLVRGKRRRVRAFFATLGVSLALSLVVLREIDVQKRFAALPNATAGDPESLRVRLGEVESFVDRYPLWHGSFRALRERSDLRVKVQRWEARQRAEEERAGERLMRRVEAAELARERGLIHASSGDMEDALVELERSLDLATPDWPRRARVERDVAALHDWLEKTR